METGWKNKKIISGKTRKYAPLCSNVLLCVIVVPFSERKEYHLPFSLYILRHMGGHEEAHQGGNGVNDGTVGTDERQTTWARQMGWSGGGNAYIFRAKIIYLYI